MFDISGKKMLNICILEILKKYTDCDHTMEQKDIIKKLESEYGMVCDRKSVKNNLMSLVDFGYDISYKETERKKANGDIEIIMTDWYYNNDFDEAELRMLIDSILFSKTIPTAQAQELIDKIIGLSNNYFSAKVKHVSNLPELEHTDNKQTMLNVEIIDDAIESNKKIEFVYNSYGTDKKLHPRRETKYVLNPYQMVANNGKYYLICNYDKADTLSYYRIDRMTEVSILEENAKPKSQIKGIEKGINLPKLMAEHVYMFSGTPETIVLKVKTSVMSDVIDWFGKNFTVFTESYSKKNYDFDPAGPDQDKVILKLNCSKEAMFHWAMQYGTSVEVLEPADLRADIRDSLTEMLDRYNK